MPTNHKLGEFTAPVETREGRHLVHIPLEDIDQAISAGETVRVAIIAAEESSQTSQDEPPREIGELGRGPPVSPGETRKVVINTTGRQGDGIAKVEGDFVVFVPGATEGEEVLIRIADVQGTYANADIIKRLD